MQIITPQSCDAINAIASGNSVVPEIKWMATATTGFGKLAPGETMRGHFAQIFDSGTD